MFEERVVAYANESSLPLPNDLIRLYWVYVPKAWIRSATVDNSSPIKLISKDRSKSMAIMTTSPTWRLASAPEVPKRSFTFKDTLRIEIAVEQRKHRAKQHRFDIETRHKEINATLHQAIYTILIKYAYCIEIFAVLSFSTSMSTSYILHVNSNFLSERNFETKL